MSNIKNLTKIYNNTLQVLDDNYYDYSTSAIEKILTTWRENKSNLIELLSKHPNWNNEKMMIQFDSDFKRELDSKSARLFFDYIYNNDFDIGVYRSYRNHIYNVWTNMCTLLDSRYNTLQNDSSYNIDVLNRYMPELHAKVGEKITRVIGRICKIMEWNKLPGFDKEYAIFCDNMSNLTVKRHTVLSLNPVDYLYMSNGNSWHSCHDIREADDPGCYSSGTISYMLDDVTMIFYTVDKAYCGDDIELEPKITRQVFCYKDGQLLQSRLYPASNDRNAEQYDINRALVQQIIAQCEDLPNLWLKKSQWTVKKERLATCYQDWYQGNGNSYFTTLNAKVNDRCPEQMIVGQEPICIECGKHHSFNENINCCKSGYYCSCCDNRVSADDVIWIDGEPYCENCVSWCEWCEEYHHYDTVQYVDSVRCYVCDSCLENEFVYCDECNEYYKEYETRYIDDTNVNVCKHCLRDYYTQCPDCGEYYYNDNLVEYTVKETGEIIEMCEYCYNDRIAEDEEKAEETEDIEVA